MDINMRHPYFPTSFGYHAMIITEVCDRILKNVNQEVSVINTDRLNKTMIN